MKRIAPSIICHAHALCVDHLFQVAKTGSSEEYATLPMTFVPGFLETMRDWLRTHVGTKP
jgi:hypothetical protein